MINPPKHFEQLGRSVPVNGHGEGPTQLRHHNYTFGVIQSPASFEVEMLRRVDAVILHFPAMTPFTDTLRAIRGHSDQAIYLKPIFLYGRPEQTSAAEETLADGHIYSLERLEEAASLVEHIVQQEDAFQRAHTVSFEDNTLTKLLRYLVSRGETELVPIPSQNAKLGYAYPIIDVNFQYRTEEKTLEILELAELENLLAGEFVDAWYVCSTCSESRIHLREVCADCGSKNLLEEDLVHHFRCAYVGPVSDFTSASTLDWDDLVCPKCEHTLRHVGIDYDKPSSIFTCINGHTSQNPRLMAKCFTCNTETASENLTKQVFKRYELTPKGRERALTGVLANVRTLGEIEGAVELAVFRTMLAYEIERMKLNGTPSTLGVIHFANAHELFSYIGQEARSKMLADLVALTREQLQSSDVISFNSFATLTCLVTSMAPEQTLTCLKKAAAAARQRIAQQFEGYQARLVPGVQLLMSTALPEEHLEALISSADSHA